MQGAAGFSRKLGVKFNLGRFEQDDPTVEREIGMNQHHPVRICDGIFILEDLHLQGVVADAPARSAAESCKNPVLLLGPSPHTCNLSHITSCTQKFIPAFMIIPTPNSS